MVLYRGSRVITPAFLKSTDNTFEEYLNNDLSEIEIPYNVTEIKEYAFYNMANLSSVQLNNSITSIDAHSFEGSGITTISIPSSVNYIGNDVFTNCSNLNTIYVDRYYNDISGAPWGATNATVIWKGKEGNVDLTEWDYYMNDSIAVINAYNGESDNVSIPNIEG